MKKLFKSSIAVLLLLTLLSGLSVSMAATTEKKHLDYKSYVLLGDSVASGWSDIEHRNSTFNRVEGSYGALLADDLGVDVYHPMACIGFRTNDLRYIFEDDYDYESDRFLFYSISKEEVDSRIPGIRKAVSEADLITLNVGCNDLGSYVGWHVIEQMELLVADNEEFFTKAREILEKNGTASDTVDSLIDIASLAGCLPEVIKAIPVAIKEGFDSFFSNWTILVEDIRALNPDAILVAIGMFDNSLQDETMSAKTIDESADSFDLEAAKAKLSIGQMIVDYANKPMRDNAEKYGYIFINPVGTLCEKQHPSYAGHRHIADLILEALPSADFPYTDVALASNEYRAIEYMLSNDIMDGASATEFAPDEALTKAVLSKAMAKINNTESSSDDSSKATRTDVIKAVMNSDSDASFIKKLKAFAFAIKLFINGGKFNISADVTRAEAANILYDYIKL